MRERYFFPQKNWAPWKKGIVRLEVSKKIMQNFFYFWDKNLLLLKRSSFAGLEQSAKSRVLNFIFTAPKCFPQGQIHSAKFNHCAKLYLGNIFLNDVFIEKVKKFTSKEKSYMKNCCVFRPTNMLFAGQYHIFQHFIVFHQ